MKTVIIILNWNGAADTLQCFTSLSAAHLDDTKILVIDNGSSSEDVQQVREHLPQHSELMCLPTNLGFAAGNNVGIRHALQEKTVEHIVLLNNDTRVDQDFLRSLITLSDRSPHLGIIGPKILDLQQQSIIQTVGDQLSAAHRMESPGADEPDHGQFDQPSQPDYVTGACLLIKRKVIEHIGLLDEDFISYWEDADWCQRARRAGWNIGYCPSAKVWHKRSASTQGRSWFSTYLYTRNRYLFFRKHPELRVSRWKILAQDLALIPYLPGLNRKNPGTGRGVIRGIVEGFFGKLHQPAQLHSITR